MKGWKNTLTACLCGAVVLAGVWGGLLADLRCRRDMGLPLPRLPCPTAEQADLRPVLGRLGQAEWLLPPWLRGMEAGLLWGLSLGQTGAPEADGRKMLVAAQKEPIRWEKV